MIYIPILGPVLVHGFALVAPNNVPVCACGKQGWFSAVEQAYHCPEDRTKLAFVQPDGAAS